MTGINMNSISHHKAGHQCSLFWRTKKGTVIFGGVEGLNIFNL